MRGSFRSALGIASMMPVKPSSFGRRTGAVSALGKGACPTIPMPIRVCLDYNVSLVDSTPTSIEEAMLSRQLWTGVV